MKCVYIKCLSFFLILIFCITANHSAAEDFVLPAPGMEVSASKEFTPIRLSGLKYREQEPFQIKFVLDPGESQFRPQILEQEGMELVNYFLSSLTVPEQHLWVNLSPYEQNRVIPDDLSRTQMGKDLLGQDYMLKQFTATLLNPDSDLGKTFWAKYQDAMVNRIWIVPDYAQLYEGEESVYIVDSRMKVMIEEQGQSREVLTVLKKDILPKIEYEINHGKNFSKLRQMYQAMILAAWYKKNLQRSPLKVEYIDQSKTSGVEISDRKSHLKIYEQYLVSLQKGTFNHIREELDPTTNEMIPRKYFTGGFDGTTLSQSFHPASKRIEKKSGQVLLDVSLINSGPRLSSSPLDVPQVAEGVQRIMGMIDAQPVPYAQLKQQLTFLGNGELPVPVGIQILDLSRRQKIQAIENIDYWTDVFVKIFQKTLQSDHGQLISQTLSLLAQKNRRWDYRFDDQVLSIMRQAVNRNPELLIPVMSTISKDEFKGSAKLLQRIHQEIVEPFIFKVIDHLSPDVLSAYIAQVQEDVPQAKDFYYFAQLFRVDPTSVTYPRDDNARRAAQQFKDRLNSGGREVLVINNIEDGMGDEIIRNGIWIQTLLHYNPALHVTIYTSRPWLYEHPRVTALNLKDFSESPLPLKAAPDMVIHSSDGQYLASKPVEESVRSYLAQIKVSALNGPIYLHYNKKFDENIPDQVVIAGEKQNIFDQNHYKNGFPHNVYSPLYHMFAAWDIPFQYQIGKMDTNVFVSTPDPGFENYWTTQVKQKSNGRKIAIFNPVGGLAENKGYRIFQRGALLKDLKAVVDQNYLVVIVPNQQSWGSPETLELIVHEFLKAYPSESPSVLMLDKAQYEIAPENVQILDGMSRMKSIELAQRAKSGQVLKYVIGKSDIVVTVEGGLTHLAVAMGKPLVTINMKEDSVLTKWFPMATGNQQVSAFYRNFYTPELTFGNAYTDDLAGALVRVSSSSRLSDEANVGGINFNSQLLTTKIESSKSSEFVKSDISVPAPGHIVGLKPILLQAVPLDNLPQFLGNAKDTLR